MKRCLLMACMIGLCFSGFAQSDDAALNKRLAIYLHHTKALDAKELMEYIHPSLFALISKEQFIEVFENTFENKDMVMRIDTITIQRVSKIFAHEKKEYRKIDYGMVMYLRFLDKTLLENEETVRTIKMYMQQAFPNGKVIFNEEEKSFLIHVSSEMVAIRDSAAAPWMFLGVERKQPALMKQLFRPQVISHFSLL